LFNGQKGQKHTEATPGGGGWEVYKNVLATK